MTTPKPYVVKRSSAGLGLFAQKAFKKGDRIIEYTGERITHDEANRRGGRYLFILNKKVIIDGKKHANTARYINHACKPNAEAVYYEEDDAVFIEAKKAIAIGDEITYNYGKEYWDEYMGGGRCKCMTCLIK